MLHDKTMFQQYMVGVGGHCEHYTPPVSYVFDAVCMYIHAGD